MYLLLPTFVFITAVLLVEDPIVLKKECLPELANASNHYTYKLQGIYVHDIGVT